MTDEKTVASLKAMLNEHSETIRKLKDVLMTRERELHDCILSLCSYCMECHNEDECLECEWHPIREATKYDVG